MADYNRGIRRRLRLADRLRQELERTPPVPPPSPAVVDLRKALQRLNDTDRDLVTLIAWDGLTVAEASAVLGLSPAAARSRLSRARSKLRSMVDDEPVHC